MMRKTRSPAVIAWVILLLAPSFLFVYNLQAALLLYNEPVERATGQLLARIRSKAVPISYLPSSPKKTSSTRNRFVIMTVGTYAYRDYLTNLACSFMRHRKYTNTNTSTSTESLQILLVSLDARLHNYPMPPNVHSVLLNNSNSNSNTKYTGAEPAHRYGQKGFNTVTRRKFSAIRAVLSAGLDVLYMDGDIVWCDPSIAAIMDISQQASIDTPIVAQTGGHWKQLMNTGLFFALANSDAAKFLLAAENLPQSEGNDQSVANKLACKRRYGGEQLGRDHCRWNNGMSGNRNRNSNSNSGMNIRVLEPKERYLLGASPVKTGNETRYIQVRKMKASRLGDMCRRSEMALMHYSYYGYAAKKSGMRRAGLWFYNARTPGRCSLLYTKSVQN